MWDGYIGQHIQRSTRNLLAVNGCLLLALLAIASLSWRYLYNFVRGPFLMDRQGLLASTIPGQLEKYFVTLQGDRTFDTGIVYMEKENGAEHVAAYYLAMQFGNRLLLVKSPLSTHPTQLIGALVPMPDTEQREVVGKIVTKNAKLQGVFLPCMLDATSFRADGYWGLCISIPLLLLALWNLRKGFARQADPDRHPIVQALKVYGPTQEVALGIESEVRAEAGAPGPGKVLLTRSWLLHPHWFGLHIRRLQDIAWCYKKVVKHYHSFIPIGKSYSVMVWDKSGKSLEISCKEKEVRAILEGLLHRVPWMLVGYGKDLEKAWRKQRAQVIQALEQRQSSYLKQQREQKEGAKLVPA